MPNQRKRGKRLVGFWVTERERTLLKDLAKRHECNVSELIKILVLKESDPKSIRNLLK